MTDNVTVTAPPTEENSQVLFVKISPELDAQIEAARRKAGVSKAGMVRMALPIGMTSVLDHLTAAAATQNPEVAP